MLHSYEMNTEPTKFWSAVVSLMAPVGETLVDLTLHSRNSQRLLFWTRGSAQHPGD